VTRAVLTAVSHRWEADLVTSLEASAGLTVVRRCADVADLLAAASAGLADVAIVSADLRALDRDALHHLARHGVRTAGAVAPGDEPAERRLRQLGLQVVVRSDAETHELEQALAELEESPDVEAAASGPRDGLVDPGPLDVPGADGRHDPLPRGGPLPRGDGSGAVGERGPFGADAWQPVEQCRVIAVWGPTGAPGRTTVALGLAAELAHRGARTLLVDADTYGSSVAQSLALLDEAPGMAAAARAADQGSLDLPALARVAPEAAPRLRVLTGVPRPDRWPELRAAAVENVLTVARQLAELVVVDCGFSIEDDEELSYDTLAPRRNAATLTTLEQADELLVVGSADPIGLQRLVRAVQDVGSVPSPTPRVVVNKLRASSVGSRPERRVTEALGRFAGMEDLHFLPWDQASLDGAMFAGCSLVEFAPQSELRRAIAALASRFTAAPEPARRRLRRR
jgi:MinD-like ATPase involved in chromosome partitioning or flagellar assembly